MKHYRYETVFYYMGILNGTIDEYHHIIERNAQEGYRYVGYIPIKLNSYGVYREIELIFEKDDDL